MLLSAEETMAINTFDGGLVLIRPVGHELGYFYYGDGPLLGTRGAFVVLQGSTPNTVSFVEY